MKRTENHPPPNWLSKDCPLDGACLTESIVYSANITTENSSKRYIGSTSNSFKSRYNGHTDSFRHRDSRSTTLSSYIWDLEDKNTKYNLNWSVMKKATPYKPGSSFCGLCISEKVEILLANQALNKRSEILEMCRHRFKWKMKNFKT